MTRFHPLSRFMPYGAPDLLASAEPRLTRAVLAGSLTMIAAFFVALVSIPRGIELPLQIVDTDIILLEPDVPPPVYRVPEQQPPAQVKPSADDLGQIEPVVEEKPVEWQDGQPHASDPAAIGTGDGARTDAPPANAIGFAAEEPLPDRGRYVHVDQLPVASVEFKPEYPPFARDAGVEGLVVVHALVGKDGRVIRVELEESRSILLLDETALEAAKRWVFQPAMTNGHPVPAWVAIPFHFVLH